MDARGLTLVLWSDKIFSAVLTSGSILACALACETNMAFRARGSGGLTKSWYKIV